MPDAAGETLAFPTLQTCEKGETGWVEVPAEGQDPEELEYPAPAFEVTEAVRGGRSRCGGVLGRGASAAAPAEETQEASTEGSGMLGWAGLVLGALGLLAGGTALARSRKSA